MNLSAASPATTVDDMELVRAKTAHWLSGPEHLSISYVYDGERLSGIPCRFDPTMTSRRIDANIVERVYEGTDPDTGLSVRVESFEYLDYPVVEWTAWFENVGDANTPILSDILGLDGSFEGASPVLCHCNGDFASENGYTPEDTPLGRSDSLQFAPEGGRPCNGSFPYYRIAFDGFGVTVAIGWPGQWSAQFDAIDTGVRVRAGQETTGLVLEPGERVRTPRITAMAWTGDTSRGINVWRRWYLAHVLPRHDGRPLAPQIGSGRNDALVPRDEYTRTNAENQVRYVREYQERGVDLDVWWIDAGWYPFMERPGVSRWRWTGSWWPDLERFPNGLKPISDAAAETGTDLLLWFEPERVARGTWIQTEHPEWVLTIQEEDDCLLNLGDPEVQRAWSDHTCNLIRDNGVKIYRQDFNFSPLPYWSANDAADRQGMTENLYVQGYLRFWDDLLERNPGVWIDSCASGGRRNDFETMRRAVPLHYSDYGYGLQYVKAGFHHTLYSWIPFFKDSPSSEDSSLDRYSIHCGLAPMTMTSAHGPRDAGDFAFVEEMRGVWRRASETMVQGDYYPLTPFSNKDDAWTVRQFDRPELGVGLLHGMRHRANEEGSTTVWPKVLRPQSDYAFENAETGATVRLSGEALERDGFTFELPARSAAMWMYRIRD